MICLTCGLEKALADFNKLSNGKPRHFCRSCQSEYQKAHYRKNRLKHIERRVYNGNLRRKLLAGLVSEMKDRACMDCGEKYPPWVMQFDHVRDVKKFNLGDAARSQFSVKKIYKEAAKCDLVCANCHADRTYRRRIGLGVAQR